MPTSKNFGVCIGGPKDREMLGYEGKVFRVHRENPVSAVPYNDLDPNGMIFTTGSYRYMNAGQGDYAWVWQGWEDDARPSDTQ